MPQGLGVDGRRAVRQQPPAGKIEVRHTAEGLVLLLSGDVDAPVVNDLGTGHPLDLSHVVAVDVGEMTYIDSTGLSFLARWAQEAARAGRPAEIRRRTPRFDRVLEVAGLAPMFVPR
jgi:anti-anti-sigma factor